MKKYLESEQIKKQILQKTLQELFFKTIQANLENEHKKQRPKKTSFHAWKIYFNLKIPRQFFVASMEPCMVRQIVAHFGQPGYQSVSDTYINKSTA